MLQRVHTQALAIGLGPVGHVHCIGINLLHSHVGHDGFLAESAALNALVEGLLARVGAAN